MSAFVPPADAIFDSVPGDSFAGPGITFDDNIVIEVAGSFTVSGDHTFDSVEIPLQGPGVFAFFDMAHVEPRADAGGLPGATLADLGAHALDSFSAGFVIFEIAGPGTPLSDGATYWIVVDPFFSTGGRWATSTGGDTGDNMKFEAAGFGPHTWSALGDQHAFRVNATRAGGGSDPILEPATLALMTLAGAALARRRCRARTPD